MIAECVPNFSEGRDPLIVDKIAHAVSNIDGTLLLDRTSDPDHNRSVLTFVASPESTAHAAFAAVAEAAALIDISHHIGVHPRIGAADVVPFVPIEDLTLGNCAEIAHAVGERVWRELHIPVFFYEAAALRPECARLEYVRKHARAGLAPDIGRSRHPTAGACVIGARKVLIAWNINLRSRDLAFARETARAIRESNGGLRAVKALGLPLESRGEVQISINLVDFELTPLHDVYQAVANRCAAHGIEVAGSELIGMIPRAALEASHGYDLHWLNLRPELVIENRLKDLHDR